MKGSHKTKKRSKVRNVKSWLSIIFSFKLGKNWVKRIISDMRNWIVEIIAVINSCTDENALMKKHHIGNTADYDSILIAFFIGYFAYISLQTKDTRKKLVESPSSIIEFFLDILIPCGSSSSRFCSASNFITIVRSSSWFLVVGLPYFCSQLLRPDLSRIMFFFLINFSYTFCFSLFCLFTSCLYFDCLAFSPFRLYLMSSHMRLTFQ